MAKEKKGNFCKLPSTEEFALLLEDRAFVDYFNVFLSLPIFGQHVFYNYIEKEFEYEPPIRKRRHYINRREVIRWLREERYPLFENSALHVEYKLSIKLRDVEIDSELLTLIDSNQRSIFGRNLLGNALGMQIFRETLRGTAGENVFKCWTDLELWRCLPEDSEEKAQVKNHIKIQYLTDGGKCDLQSRNKNLVFQGRINFELIPEHEIYEELLGIITDEDELFIADTEEAFLQLQRILLIALKRYWVPRYLLNIRRTIPKSTLDVLYRESPGDIGSVSAQRRLRCQMMFPRVYSAAKTPQSSPTPTTPVFISNTSHDIPGEETLDTESDISLPVAGIDEQDDTETKIAPTDLLSLWGGHKVSLMDEKDEKYSEHRSSITWVSRSDEDLLGYSELADWEKEYESIDSDKQPLMIPLSVTSYLCGRKRLTIGSFPTLSNRILCALASDNLAGEPFKKFLNQQTEVLDLGYLNFWSDVRHYLDTDEAYLDSNGQPMKKVLGQKISYKYLQSKGEYCGIFSEGLKMALLLSMTGEDHISLLCTAQDIVTGALKTPWKEFMQNERKTFRKVVCGNKRYDRNVVEMSNLQSDGKDPLLFINVTGQPDISSTTRPTSSRVASVESRPWSHASDFGVVYLSEEEMWRAFEITVLCSQYGRTAMYPHKKAQIGDLIDVLYSDHGSLHIAKPNVVKQTFLRNLIFKPKLDLENLKVSRKVLLDRPEMLGVEEKPKFNRMTLRRNGVLIERPQRPRNFLECLNVPLQFDFFKRFMVASKCVMPALFWKAVEELKEQQNFRQRNTLTLQIFRRFFSKSAKQGFLLDCSDDIIRQIPTMDKVPPSVLICAQASVYRSMERKWYPRYLETFPPETNEESMSETILPQITGIPNMLRLKVDRIQKPRKIRKRKTLHLWHGFISAVAEFLSAMNDAAEVKLFEMYLENEKVRETQTSRIERALLNSSTITAFQTRVILKDRIVVINKLPCDLRFWLENQKYVQQIDTVSLSVNISRTDTDLLYEKAKALIDCFLQSDIPPRVQVNVPSDLALTTTNNLSITGPDRGLFHEAAVSVFPLLYHFWRNFQTEWLKGHKPSALLAKIEAKIKPKRPVTPHKGKQLPTYVDVRLSQCNVVSGPMYDDDHFRINFSIMGGVKLVFPPAKGIGLKFGQADMSTLSPNSPKMKPMKHSKTSFAKIIEGKRDEKEHHKEEKHSKKDATKKSKEKMDKADGNSKVLLKEESTKITSHQVEKARRLSQLVEDINLQSVRGRRISKYKTLDQVVLAALGGGVNAF